MGVEADAVERAEDQKCEYPHVETPCPNLGVVGVGPRPLWVCLEHFEVHIAGVQDLIALARRYGLMGEPKAEAKPLPPDYWETAQ